MPTRFNVFTGTFDLVNDPATGAGDVTGPLTSTDNAVARFDGTGGNDIQNSGVIIDDSDAVTGIASLTLAAGASITEFSTDGTLGGNSDTAVPTEQAVKTYVDAAGGGDVSGPASSTDNAIARYDSTTGKIIQNSSVTVTDAANIATFDNLAFNTSPTPLTTEGSVYWDATDHTLAIKNDESDVTLQVGQEAYIRVYNDSGSDITNGSVVYASGAESTEDRITIGLADASTAETSRVIGFATHTIENATYGYVTQFGYVHDVDTSGYTDGDPVYLSTTAGEFIGTPPNSPNFNVFLGYISKVDASTGIIFVTTIGNTSGGDVSGTSESVVLSCRKGSVGTINRGQPVYISGYNVGADEFEVELADANGTGTYPAVGLADASITNSASGNVVLSGRINDINTGSYSVGDALYLSETVGTLTSTRPSATTSQVQRIGTVARSNASNGVILVQGAGRTNDTPNAASGMTFNLSSNTLTGTTAEFNTALSDGSFATLAGSETLTNKTINTASNTLTIAGSDVSTGQVAVANGGTGAATAADARTNLGVAIGSDVQAYDADLAALSALASTGILARTGAATYAERTITGTTNEISVANGDGVSANPTLSLPATIDLGGKTSLEIPNSATPTVDADGEIAVDTTVTDWSHGILKYYGGEEMGVVAMPIAQFTSPTDNYVVTYNATNDEFELQAGGSGGMPTYNAGRDAAGMEPNSGLTFPAPKNRDFGTLTKDVLGFDATGPEYATGMFRVPDDLGSGNVTFEIVGSAATAAASKNVKFSFDFITGTDSSALTGSYGTAEVWDDQAVSATQDDMDIISNTETVANLGWTAGYMVYWRLYRAAATTNNLSGDYDVMAFNIMIPRA